MKYANGIVYEGEWKGNKGNGQGKKYTLTSGEIYKGEWKDYKKNGQGTMKNKDGAIYEGEWKNEKKNGRGIMKYARATTRKRSMKKMKGGLNEPPTDFKTIFVAPTLSTQYNNIKLKEIIVHLARTRISCLKSCGSFIETKGVKKDFDLLVKNRKSDTDVTAYCQLAADGSNNKQVLESCREYTTFLRVLERVKRLYQSVCSLSDLINEDQLKIGDQRLDLKTEHFGLADHEEYINMLQRKPTDGSVVQLEKKHVEYIQTLKKQLENIVDDWEVKLEIRLPIKN